jgi:hypothetical protein
VHAIAQLFGSAVSIDRAVHLIGPFIIIASFGARIVPRIASPISHVNMTLFAKGWTKPHIRWLSIRRLARFRLDAQFSTNRFARTTWHRHP